jgi:hypothetical protein
VIKKPPQLAGLPIYDLYDQNASEHPQLKAKVCFLADDRNSVYSATTENVHLSTLHGF